MSLGYNYDGNSSPKTLHDSLNCSDEPHGHGAKIKIRKSQILNKKQGNLWKIPVIILQLFKVFIRSGAKQATSPSIYRQKTRMMSSLPA